uniref:Putative axin n=1 Tax=Corethrella appendiculata TaxID=1370023 RepID=U5ER69_9DIPT
MSQSSSNKFDDFEGSGPRPPVPGKESRRNKMTESNSSEKSRESPPNYCRWAEKLSYLLDDAEGCELFKRYVEMAGGVYSDQLRFYFACEGLKQRSEPEEIRGLVCAIYRRFLKRSTPESGLYASEELKNKIKNGSKNIKILTADIFNELQQNVAKIISQTTYPLFLQSDYYIQHVQNMQSVGYNMGGDTLSSQRSSSTSKLFSHSASALLTLHEDVELTTADSIEQLYGAIGSGYNTSSMCSRSVPMGLTKDALMATEQRRLEMRPQGSNGFSVYNSYASYNPVSRRDSELASLSSGHADSVILSNDGRPNSQKYQHQQQRKIHENASINIEDLKVIPRTLRGAINAPPKDPNKFAALLASKLEVIKQKQDSEQLVATKLADVVSKLKEVDEDQDILDQHVSRVWADETPTEHTPGTKSPCPLNRRRTRESGISSNSMRHSKSMPDSNPPPPLQAPRKLSNKWPSVNIDSGISLSSLDTSCKNASSSRPVSRNMQYDSTNTFGETKRIIEDEIRRSKRYPQSSQSLPPPLPPQISQIVPPPIPAKPQQQEFTVVVFSFCDDEVPYRYKIPGVQPTLKQFKDLLPKKGNYRFFFKTRCDDVDNPVIQEEINNDFDILPLYEGKVNGTVRPAE